MIEPIIENSYLVSSKLNADERSLLFAKLTFNDPQALYNFLSTPKLVNLLTAKEGFSPDEDTGQSVALTNDSNGIDAYLIPSGRFTVLKICSPNGFGIDPDYLDGLVFRIKEDFRIKEIPGAKKTYHNDPAPYDWNTPQGRAHLAGAPRQIIP